MRAVLAAKSEDGEVPDSSRVRLRPGSRNDVPRSPCHQSYFCLFQCSTIAGVPNIGTCLATASKHRADSRLGQSDVCDASKPAVVGTGCWLQRRHPPAAGRRLSPKGMPCSLAEALQCCSAHEWQEGLANRVNVSISIFFKVNTISQVAICIVTTPSPPCGHFPQHWLSIPGASPVSSPRSCKERKTLFFVYPCWT